MVKDFHVAFGHGVGDRQQKLSLSDKSIRAGFMQEELDEFMEATTLVDQVDALVDLLYFAFGTLVQMGVDPEEAFNIVHSANMTKLWPDGKPRYRESDGKVIKPDGWVAPEAKLAELFKE